MSKAAKQLLENEDDYKYGIVGADTCMGDHKVSFCRGCRQLMSNQ